MPKSALATTLEDEYIKTILIAVNIANGINLMAVKPEHLIHGIDKKVGGDVLKIKTTNGRKVCPKDPFLKKMLLFAFI